jgi:hypothetical protein
MLHQSDHADQQCLKLLEMLRDGRLAEVENCLVELERIYHFANSAPSWKGFFNLTHCFRALLTDHLLRTSKTAAKTKELPRGHFPNLIAITH